MSGERDPRDIKTGRYRLWLHEDDASDPDEEPISIVDVREDGKAYNVETGEREFQYGCYFEPIREQTP